MNDETEQTTLVLTSNDFVHVPGMMQYIIHVYKTDKELALSLANDMFNGMVKEEALRTILSEERLPVYDLEHIAHDSQAYVFDDDELKSTAVDAAVDTQ